MTTSINTNAIQLYNLLIETYPDIIKTQYTKNQIKAIIYLYFTDNPEIATPLESYKTPQIKTVFAKYVSFLKYQLNVFKYIVDENKEYANITATNTTLEDAITQFTKLNIKEIIHPKKRHSLFHSEKDEPEKTNEFIKSFMHPHDNLNASVSYKIYKLMKTTVEFDNEKAKHSKKTQSSAPILSRLTCKMAIIQNDILKNKISSNPTLSRVEMDIFTLQNLTMELFNYSNELDMLYNAYSHLKLFTKYEKRNQYDKEYCRKTVLLDVERITATLNADVIQHIKSFIQPDMLEKIRIAGIKDKYFAHPRLKVNHLLNSMTVEQIHNLCKNKLYILYDMVGFETDGHINAMPTNVPFMLYLENRDIHDLYDSDVLKLSRKNAVIRQIITDDITLNYFEFQRDLYIVSKMLNEQRRKKCIKK